MLVNLLLGSLFVFITMIIQVVAAVLMIRYLIKVINNSDQRTSSFGFDTFVISMVLVILFIGHLVQIAIWAGLFMYLGEFSDFLTAFYHSTVNFASLGYGDIVMSEKWRLLGGLEASNGVLLFGLSAGTMLAVMNNLFTRHKTAGVNQLNNNN